MVRREECLVILVSYLQSYKEWLCLCLFLSIVYVPVASRATFYFLIYVPGNECKNFHSGTFIEKKKGKEKKKK